MISRPELAKVIAERTLHISDTAQLKNAIAGYLLEEGRVTDLDSLMRDVVKYRKENGHVEATIVSAYALVPVQIEEAMDVLKSEYPTAKSYVLNQRVDSMVVGGVRLEMAGEELDLTVRAKLNTLKRLTAARSN